MKVNVNLFARARDLCGSDSICIELPSGASVADLRSRLVEQFPALGTLGQYLLIAIDRDYAADSVILPEDSEVACFPPVSGG